MTLNFLTFLIVRAVKEPSVPVHKYIIIPLEERPGRFDSGTLSHHTVGHLEIRVGLRKLGGDEGQLGLL